MDDDDFKIFMFLKPFTTPKIYKLLISMKKSPSPPKVDLTNFNIIRHN